MIVYPQDGTTPPFLLEFVGKCARKEDVVEALPPGALRDDLEA